MRIKNLIKLFAFLALLSQTGCLVTPKKPSVHADVYLGSDELYVRILQAKEAAKRILNELDAYSGSALEVCPSDFQDPRLSQYLSANEDERSQAGSDLLSSGFRETLKNAIDRLVPDLIAPVPAFGLGEEARMPASFPSEGNVSAWFNAAKLNPYSLLELVRVAVHEAVHIHYAGKLDSAPHGQFDYFSRYANYIGACLGSRTENYLQWEGTYQAQLFSGAYRLPVVLRIQSENSVSGFIGAIPGRSQGIRHIQQGTLNGNQLQFQVDFGAETHHFSGTLTNENGIQISGTHGPATSPDERTWSASMTPVYHADYHFNDFASDWIRRAGTLPNVFNEQLQGPAGASFYYAAQPVSMDGKAISVNISLSGNAYASAGFLIGGSDPQNCLILNMDRYAGGDTYSIVHVCGESSAHSWESYGNVPSELNVELQVQMCGSNLALFVNGTLQQTVPASLLSQVGLVPIARTGTTVNSPTSYVSNYQVRGARPCP
ncbi:MAG: hypothetical protein KDD51_13665 [Bdellovibrionales bacterium]|nr:hypothetical protein [Bdellovibrionales bacterium]